MVKEKRMERKVQIMTTAGFKYSGPVVSETNSYIEIIDKKEGKIKIPLTNVSFLKEIGGNK